MAFLRKRASGNYALTWKWKGKPYIKGLGTKDLPEAEQIKKDAVDQLARIRSGDSALASKLLANGHSIVDVFFGSEEIGHLIASPADDNPLTLSQLKEAFIDNLNATSRTPGHIDGTRGHLDHFIRVLGDVRVMSLTDADMTAFQNQCGKETTAKKTAGKKKVATKKSRKKASPTSKRLISQGTIRSDFKSLRSSMNWATSRKPPLLAECPFTIPKITSSTVKPFLPTEEIKRLVQSEADEAEDELRGRWVLDLKEINDLVKMTAEKIPEMLLPIQLVCSTGMRRVQLVRLKPSDYVKGRLTVTSKKGARQKGLFEISLTIVLRDTVDRSLRGHIEALPRRSKIMFPIFDAFDYTRGNQGWKGKSKRSVEQRRCDRADRLIEKLVKDTDFERLDGYHALRLSFTSILVAKERRGIRLRRSVGIWIAGRPSGTSTSCRRTSGIRLIQSRLISKPAMRPQKKKRDCGMIIGHGTTSGSRNPRGKAAIMTP